MFQISVLFHPTALTSSVTEHFFSVLSVIILRTHIPGKLFHTYLRKAVPRMAVSQTMLHQRLPQFIVQAGYSHTNFALHFDALGDVPNVAIGVRSVRYVSKFGFSLAHCVHERRL